MPSELNAGPLIHLHAITDVGRLRSHNEDNFIACPDLHEKNWFVSDQPTKLTKKGCVLVVADGMGGTNAGEVASKIAVDSVQHTFNAIEFREDFEDRQVQDYLYQAILEAHKAIVASSVQKPEYSGMGTTILIAWVFPAKAHLGWCGDSRAYLYRKKEGLKILTKDHSWVWELVEAGKITPDEADVHPNSNIITQSLGDLYRNPQPDFAVCPLEEGDRLLLCTDGLNNMINSRVIEEILGSGAPLARTNRKLVDAANNNGGADNITVLSLEVRNRNPEEKRSSLLWFLSIIICCFFIWWLIAEGRVENNSREGTQAQPENPSGQAWELKISDFRAETL